MSEKERINCIFYLKTIKEIIEAHGLSVTLDPVYDVPRGQTY